MRYLITDYDTIIVNGNTTLRGTHLRGTASDIISDPYEVENAAWNPLHSIKALQYAMFTRSLRVIFLACFNWSQVVVKSTSCATIIYRGLIVRQELLWSGSSSGLGCTTHPLITLIAVPRRYRVLHYV